MSFTIDDKASSLLITADPKWLPRYVVDLERRQPHQVEYLNQNGAFLNYAVRASFEDAFDFTMLSIPWETGVKIGDFLGFSSFSYRKTTRDGSAVRLLTNITMDDPSTLRRYILGDALATSGIGGGSGIFGGLSVFKNFALKPYVVRFPGLELSGLLSSPSEVDVYINNQLVRQEELPSGEFTLLDLPVTTGGGLATLVVTDAYGRTEHITHPFYISSRLLTPGLHEYSYTLGWQRQAFGSKSFEYEDLAFAGFHRLGLSPNFTGGLSAEIDHDTFNLGASATVLIGTAGELLTDLRTSYRDGNAGFRGLVSYSYASRYGFNFNFILEGLTRNFASIFATRTPFKLRALANAGVNFRRLGSLSATYSRTAHYESDTTQQMSLGYRKLLTRNLSLFVLANRIEGIIDRTEVFAGLNMFLGGNKFVSLSDRFADGHHSLSASLLQNPPLGTGIGYRFQVDADDDANTSGLAQVQYRSPYGVHAFDYRRDNAGQNRYDLTLAGSLAVIGGTLHFSRPITDSFALVKVSDLKGVNVYYNNQPVGVTNGRGELLVPSLLSYLDNRLSIEPLDVPLEYNILETSRHVTTPFRSGARVAFDVDKLRSFEGRLFIVADGQKKPAEYAVLEITVRGRPTEHIIGIGGAFYLENLPTGTFPARVILKDKACHFELTIPEREGAIVDLGEVVCEIR